MDRANRQAHAALSAALQKHDPDVDIGPFKLSGERFKAFVHMPNVTNFEIRALEDRLGFGVRLHWAVVTPETGSGLWMYVPLQKTREFKGVRQGVSLGAYALILAGVMAGALTLLVNA